MSAPALEVRDLTVEFATDRGPLRAVDGVSFAVAPGRTLAIVGESGCGKSVAMRAVLQLVEPPGRIVSGQILFRQRASTNGEAASPGGLVDLARLAPRGAAMREIRGAEIALIPQEPMAAFSPVHTVGDQIVEALLLHQRKWRPTGPALSRGEARQMTAELFRDVGISMPGERVDAYAWQLSGGLRQRAMIAMALSCRPRLLIADEPTTAIDVTTQAQVLNLLRELQRRHSTAIVFITHDLGVIAQLAHHVVVMYLGRVMEQGSVDDIFHAPRHPYTRALLRSIPSLLAEPQSLLPTIAGSIPHPLGRPPGCAFHPRCRDAMPGVCDQHAPALKMVAPAQTAACFLYHREAEP
jgi:oligopeptide/dipeptide ABC transporter ATP-binding protein